MYLQLAFFLPPILLSLFFLQFTSQLTFMNTFIIYSIFSEVSNILRFSIQLCEIQSFSWKSALFFRDIDIQIILVRTASWIVLPDDGLKVYFCL